MTFFKCFPRNCKKTLHMSPQKKRNRLFYTNYKKTRTDLQENNKKTKILYNYSLFSNRFTNVRYEAGKLWSAVILTTRLKYSSKVLIPALCLLTNVVKIVSRRRQLLFFPYTVHHLLTQRNCHLVFFPTFLIMLTMTLYFFYLKFLLYFV